jgi:hypothetical protein
MNVDREEGLEDLDHRRGRFNHDGAVSPISRRSGADAVLD